jgi:hypothetical protein
MIGLLNIGASFGVCWPSVGAGRSRCRRHVYATCAVALLAILVASKTELTFVVFAAVLGLTFM